jgi:hypothetical protein
MDWICKLFQSEIERQDYVVGDYAKQGLKDAMRKGNDNNYHEEMNFKTYPIIHYL